MTDFDLARYNMVEGQLRPNRVTDPALLEALATIPRELFVPRALRGVAYVDEDLHLGEGRWLTEPMVLARLLATAAPLAEDVALVVGGTTGYAAAVLARICGTVISLDPEPRFAQQATQVLAEIAADGAIPATGPLADGWPALAPYSLIVLDGAVAEVPPALLDQLAEGGRMVGVTAAEERLGRACLWSKLEGVVSARILFDAAVHWLPGLGPRPRFVF